MNATPSMLRYKAKKPEIVSKSFKKAENGNYVLEYSVKNAYINANNKPAPKPMSNARNHMFTSGRRVLALIKASNSARHSSGNRSTYFTSTMSSPQIINPQNRQEVMRILNTKIH